MKKLFLSIFMSMLLSAASYASDNWVHGFECGAGIPVCKFSHYNFVTTDGYRAEASSSLYSLYLTGTYYVHTGYNLSDNENLSLYGGLCALNDEQYALPLSLRYSRYFGVAGTDRWMSYADAGLWYDLSNVHTINPIGKLGGGYSLHISPRASLEILGALQVTLSHPKLYDSINTDTQAKKLLHRNNDWTAGVVFSINIYL